MLKKIHLVGLALFIIGFGVFISLFFLSDFRLDDETLKSNLTEEQYRFSKENFSDILDKTYSNQFVFVRKIKASLKQTNTFIQSTYAISEDIANDMALQSENHTFKSTLIDAVISTDNNITSWQNKQLKSYTSWMENKQFESSNEMATQLTNTIKSVNANIANDKGFSQNTINNLAFSLTKQSTIGTVNNKNWLWLLLSFVLPIVGAGLYLLPRLKLEHPGIKNNHIFHNALTSRGWLGILVGSFLITFYVFLYWYPEYMTSWIVLVDPISHFFSGNGASQWFLYGFLYTLAILVMGVRMIIKYRHSKYHIIRTISVMFFQTAFAFAIPEILVRLNQPYFDFKNIWPLDYDFFFDYNIKQLVANGTIGIFMLVWGIALFAIGVPLFTYLYGKRWYCSWVCGCGGLAETLGDPYRQLSDKSLGAWKVERILIHSVLVFAVVMTAGVLYTYFTGASTVLGVNTYQFRSVYGFAIGSAFSGVIGTGFYPFMGNRVWCRFGCPLAAYLGLVQRFKSRFRITTNGGQCISCGNCSTYCEMGIDVRWYAQRGQNIVRSSCVGCGVCSSVCPRGVLKLENKEEKGRFNEPILIGNNSIKISS